MGWEEDGNGEKMEVSLGAVGQNQKTGRGGPPGPHQLGWEGAGTQQQLSCNGPVSISQDSTEAGRGRCAPGQPYLLGGLECGVAPHGPACAGAQTIFPAVLH